MGFGDGFQPVRVLQLENGEYYCKIVGVEPINGQYGTYLKITVKVQNHSGYTPNLILLNARPLAGHYKANGNPITDDDLRKWDKQMTTFFDAFGIPCDTTDPFTDIKSWLNHKGWCRVSEQYDPKEPDKKSKKFKELHPFVKVEEPVQQPAPEDYPNEAPVEAFAPMPSNDEIPF